jgi:two-component system, cell cycle response regulator DivK
MVSDIRSKLILIVEDDPISVKYFEAALRSRGYTCVVAGRGMDAVVLARLYKPSLILMDMQLPDVWGLEVTQAIKADLDLSKIPIVAVTAFATLGDEQTFLRGGCDGYLPKPISLEKLLATVEHWFDRQ